MVFASPIFASFASARIDVMIWFLVSLGSRTTVKTIVRFDFAGVFGSAMFASASDRARSNSSCARPPAMFTSVVFSTCILLLRSSPPLHCLMDPYRDRASRSVLLEVFLEVVVADRKPFLDGRVFPDLLA
jgi:hypothetical protein